VAKPSKSVKKREAEAKKLAKRASIHLSALHSNPWKTVPAGPDWIHEKHEGYRLIDGALALEQMLRSRNAD